MATVWERQAFANNVMRDLESYRTLETKSLNLSNEASRSLTASAATTGHPQFQHVQLNKSQHCEAVAMFLDLEAFTARTFWDSPEETVRLARSVLGQVSLIIQDYGGHVLGLRGDGVFACFGPNYEAPDIPIALSLAAGAFALDVIQGGLNNTLALSGIAPIQARVGADFGRLDFTRMGTQEASEVNIIGFAANFAAKCEKYANAWEFVAGENYCGMIQNKNLLTRHDESPKSYTRDYTRGHYSFNNVNWAAILPDINGIKEKLNGASASQVVPVR